MEKCIKLVRIRPCVLVAIISVSLLLAFCACSRKKGERPNVLLIVVDALRSDHLGAYGYERDTSPFFDKWSKQGVLFENVTSQSSWTKTSMASMFSGLEAETARVFLFKDTYPDEVVTLAEILSGHGYQTAYVQTNAWLYDEFGFDQGFEDLGQLGSKAENQPAKKAETRAWRVNEQARIWLENRDKTRPFFLYLHYMDVHGPYLPPPPHNRIFDPEFSRELRDHIFALKFVYNYIFSPTEEELFKELKQDHDLLGHLISLYDGEIHYFDQEFEKLMACLEDFGIIENTLVIFASDHGEQFLEHGGLRHGTSLYREELDVPLVFFFPRVLPAGKRIRNPVRNLDIMPTILDILGISEVSAGKDDLILEGQSLFPYIRGKAVELEPGPAFSRLKILYDWPVNNRDQVLVKDREWVLIRDNIKGSQELYNLSRDPGERHNLVNERPDIVKGLSMRLDEHLDTCAELRKELGLPDMPVEIMIDEKMRKSLEAVGYFKR